ncbi:MAG: hypothetical protein D6778_06070 [Nitrospirae bacterium]|nr:MAG: hypothetical protein D6778_06070 [Nitrospirota bacterium]
MGTISIILRRPPYGSIDAPEAIRHALGGVTKDMTVNLILLDGGAQAARKSQDTQGTEYQSIEDGIKDCIDMGVQVVVDRSSLKEEHLEVTDLVEGVKVLNSYELAELIKNSDTVMLF